MVCLCCCLLSWRIQTLIVLLTDRKHSWRLESSWRCHRRRQEEEAGIQVIVSSYLVTFYLVCDKFRDGKKTKTHFLKALLSTRRMKWNGMLSAALPRHLCTHTTEPTDHASDLVRLVTLKKVLRKWIKRNQLKMIRCCFMIEDDDQIDFYEEEARVTQPRRVNWPIF